jgi:hypothetical protein
MGLGLGDRNAFTIAQDPGHDQEQAIVRETMTKNPDDDP